MTSVNVTTNKNIITVQEGDTRIVKVATQGPQGASITGPAGAAGGSNIVQDTTPQLGGDLDANGNDIDMGTNVITDARVGEWLATKTKVDGIENSATADMTGSEIKTAYESESDTNAFTDALKTKLEGVESGSTGDMTGSEIKTAYEGESNTNAFTDTEKTKLSGIATSANNYAISSDLLDEDNMATNSASKVPSQQSVKAYVDANSSDTTYTAGTGLNLSGTEFSVTSLALTTVQEAANETAMLALTTQEGDVVVRTDENKTYVKNAGTAGTMADFTLLRTPTDSVLSVNGNTGAITAAQIASAVESASDSNTFTDADHTKLNGIATGAEVNVQSDWNSSSGDSQILNKPTIPTNTDTTYGISCVDGDNSDEEKIRLTAGGSGSGTDDVVLEAGTGLSIARSGDKITFTNTVTDTNTTDLVSDTSPQLGGSLDVNSQDIVSTSNGDIDLDPNGSGKVVFKGNSTKGSGQFVLNCENNSHGIVLKGPPHSAAASYTFTFPNDDGNADQVLKTDGSGTTSWVDKTTAYTNSSVDTHLNTSTASTNEVLSWNGSDYDWVAQSGGGGSSLTVQDEGSALSTAATTLNFVGSGVAATGTGATKTITISGGGGSSTSDLIEIMMFT